MSNIANYEVARLDRALNQRLYLLNDEQKSQKLQTNQDQKQDEFSYEVLGSTGSVYKVVLSVNPSCNCPDFLKRSKRCKHILFILHRYLGLPKVHKLLFQEVFSLEELHSVIKFKNNNSENKTNNDNNDNNNSNNNSNNNNHTNIIAPTYIQQKYLALKRSEEQVLNIENVQEAIAQKTITVEDDCCICFESLLENSEVLVWCKNQCGNSLHKS